MSELATPRELKSLTGQETPKGQYEVLVRELGVRPIFIDGRVRIYKEALVDAQRSIARPMKPAVNQGKHG